MKSITQTTDYGAITVSKENSMSFKKGDTIVVTDPCYWFDIGDIWSDFCDIMFPDGYEKLPKDEQMHDFGKVTFVFDNGQSIEFLYSSTAYGDGQYDVSSSKLNFKNGQSFGVDAGMFAIVNAEDIKKFNKKEYDNIINNKSGLYVVAECTENIEVDVDGSNMDGDVICVTDESDIEQYHCIHCGMVYQEDEGYDSQFCDESCYDEYYGYNQEDEEDEY